jgi:hypothetical protein
MTKKKSKTELRQARVKKRGDKRRKAAAAIAAQAEQRQAERGAAAAADAAARDEANAARQAARAAAKKRVSEAARRGRLIALRSGSEAAFLAAQARRNRSLRKRERDQIRAEMAGAESTIRFCNDEIAKIDALLSAPSEEPVSELA